MKKRDLITKILSMDYPQKLEKGWEGACPCFYYSPTVDGKRLNIHGHCWRTTDNGISGGCECSYNGLHIKGKLSTDEKMEIGEAFKKQLDAQEWYSEWDLCIS